MLCDFVFHLLNAAQSDMSSYLVLYRTTL